MSQAYVIEVHFKAAGIVVRDGQHFRFFSSSRDFDALEGRQFASAGAAEAAARDHASKRRSTGSVQERTRLAS